MGALHVLAIVLSVCNTTGILPSALTPVLSNVSHIFSTCSQGVARVAARVHPDVVAVPCTRGCDTGRWADAADAATGASPPSHRVYVVPDIPACTWGGLGEINGTRVWINAAVATMPDAYVHELGHNLGLDHAGTTNNTYGDGSDPMGYCCPIRCFHAPHMEQLGWVPRAPAAVPGDLALSAKSYVRLPITANASRWAYTQYRPRNGTDAGLPPGFGDAVDVYTVAAGNPLGARTTWQAALRSPGDAWGGTAIRLVSIDGGVANVLIV